MPSHPVSIRLFGPLDVSVGGVPLAQLRSQKGRWLLALLALRLGREVDRSWLAGTLWPESDEDRALGSLRRALTDLRAALGDEAGRLASPGARTLALGPEGVWADVADFDAGVVARDEAGLRAAVALYRGPLLEGCAEEWVVLERESRALAFLGALDRLAALRLEAGDDAEAEGLLRRAVAESPLREGTWRALMELLAGRGDFAAAGEAFRELRLHLARELGARPAAETEQLYQRIRADGQARAAAPAPGARRAEVASDALGAATEQPPQEPRADGPHPATQAGTRPGEPAPEDRQAAAGTGGGASGPGAAADEAPRLSPPRPMPEPLTPLLGRDDELAQVSEALAASRLVTLTGPGGIGKSRLALRAAALAAPRFADGARFVPLASRGDDAGVLEAVADALGVRPAGAAPLADAVTQALASAQVLLVLDNCEHLPAAAPVAEALLQACPDVAVLATSRSPLGVPGEEVLRVPALPVPAEGASPADVAASAAARLLLARARRDASTAEDAAALASICRRLDGIPLALELAAARLSVLTLPQLAARLDERLALLTGGARTAPPRHQTLRATLDWSHDLLSGDDRAALRALSVFAGPFDAALAAAVLRAAPPDAEPPLDVLDTLARLVDQSLLVADPPRFRMLESTRAYARERLAEAGELALYDRHADAVLALAQAAEPHLRGPGSEPWLQRLEAVHAELIAAVEWLLAPARGPEGAERALRLTGAAWRFWSVRSHFHPGRRLLDAALHRGASCGPALRQASLHGAGTLAWMQGDMDTALVRHGQALVARRTVGDRVGVAWSLTNLGIVAMFTQQHDRAGALHQEALATFREAGDGLGVCAALMNRAIVASYQGDLAQAQALHEESLAEARALQHPETIARALANVGYVEQQRGLHEAAEGHMREGLAAQLAVGDRYGVIFDLEVLARIALDTGRAERGAWLLGAAAAARRALAISVRPSDRDAIAELVARARRAADGAFQAAWDRGASLDLEAAGQRALEPD